MTNQFLIFGAGAIGTYLGGSLALAGNQVLFIEKGRDIPSLRQRGLRLSQDEKEHHLSGVEFFSGLEILQSREIDLVILAVKSYHLDAIIPALIANQAHLPPLLTLQNGVESEKKLSKVLDQKSIIPGTVTTAIDRVDKGRIVVQKFRGMGIAGDHSRITEYQTIFNEAGLNCSVFRRADAMKWSKLITNVLGNASAAILDLSPAAIYAHPGLYQVELDQIREGLKVMRKLRIPTVNLPGIPVSSLASMVRFLPASLSQSVLSNLIGKGRGEKMPSFHIDLHHRRGKSEVGVLNGAIVQAGIKTGVATPVNRFLFELLSALIAGDIPLTKYQNKPDLFLNDLDSYQASGSLS
jgi:2-dehydropantoate 2-reductase